MLKPLLELAHTIDLPPFRYARSMKHWQIELDGEGHFQAIKPLTRDGENGKLELGRANLPPSPHLNRNSMAAKLLTDTTEYVLGLGEERAAKYHKAYVKLLKRCFEVTHDLSVKAVIWFLEDQPLQKVEEYLDNYPTEWQLEKSHVIRFLVDSHDPTEFIHIQNFWVDCCSSNDLPKHPCLVTGEVNPITTKFEHKLKSVPNTQASGASFISAYCDSFHSYGRGGAEVSPIGVETAEKLGQVLSYLEFQSQHRLRIGPILYLFWGREASLNLNDWLNQPSLKDVRALLQAFNTSQPPSDVDAFDFYVLALSGNSGRVIVRDFLQTNVEQVKLALGKWFDAQSLIDLDGEVREPVGLYALAAQAYRDAAKELQPHTLVALARCALQPNIPLPKDLLLHVLERARMQHGSTYRQASLIKLILTSWGVKITVNLDERMETLTRHNHKMAYCCGRLLATFGTIQYYALGQVNRSVIDSAYGAAATTPNRVFGHLEVKVQAHLAQLRKAKEPKKRAIANLFRKQLEEIHAAMPWASFPNTLTLEEQGIFALGYWHQKAYRLNKNQNDFSANTFEAEETEDERV